MSGLRGITKTHLTKNEVLATVRFGDYWPPEAVDRIREFLLFEYDPETMPPLALNRDDKGELWMMGWRNELHPEGLSLLEAARGYGLTDEDHRWILATPVLASPAVRVEESLHRSGSLRGMRG